MDDTQFLIDAAKQGGPFVAIFMVVMYFLERTERKETQKKYEETVERSLTAMTSMEAALRAMNMVLGRRE